MSMNIKNKEASRLTRQLSELTGESLTTAITEAVRERLDRVRRERGVDLAERLLLIGRDCATHLRQPFHTINHADMRTARLRRDQARRPGAATPLRAALHNHPARYPQI